MILLGNLQSKANRRRNVTNRRTGKPMFIKSEAALAVFEDMVRQAQAQWKKDALTAPCRLTAHIYYSSRRPDLEDSLLMDILQSAGVVKNDRLIFEKHVWKELDRDNPRVVVEVEEI